MSEDAKAAKTRGEIIQALKTTVAILGGDYTILASLGSLDDTLTDEEVLSLVHRWNSTFRPGRVSLQ